MYKIEWQGMTLTIGQEFALKVVEAVTMNIATEDAPVVEEPQERTTDEAQTTLTHYVTFKRDHAKGWRSHCARCGAVGRKCLERLNGRCHTCKLEVFV